ncbi:MAG: hypothetical protein JXD21_02085 [Candidatus Omnitrophica bacterium]|nr:hypothetical protein [Candidatus Omnitrophota bacterium]
MSHLLSRQHVTAQGSGFVIRTCIPGDRQALRTLCCDTAYFGEPCEVFFPDREFLADLIMEYYIRYEPQHTWVAQVQGEVVAYLSAGFDETRYSRKMLFNIVPGSLFRALLRGKLWDRRIWELIKYNLRALLSGETNLAKGTHNEFPVHIHQNTKLGFRGKGIGKQLLYEFLKEVKNKKARGVRFRALRQEPGFFFFDKNEFKKIDCIRVPTWELWLKKSPLYFMEYGKKFTYEEKAENE